MTRKKSYRVSKPTAFPLMSQVTPHLYKLNPETLGKNFAIIISDNGHGLVLDCGLFPEVLLHRLIQGMKKHFGLKQIDALWISHMHGDHFLLGPTLREKYGTKTWTLDRIADKCENPRRYDYAALNYSYGSKIDGKKIDKSVSDAETVDMTGTKQVKALSLTGGGFDARHLLSIAADGASRYTVHYADGPIVISYLGTCK